MRARVPSTLNFSYIRSQYSRVLFRVEKGGNFSRVARGLKSGEGANAVWIAGLVTCAAGSQRLLRSQRHNS